MIKKKVDFIKFMVMIISNFIIKFHIYKNIIFSLYYNSTRNIIQEINNCELSIISDLKYINNLLNLVNIKIFNDIKHSLIIFLIFDLIDEK